MNEIKNLWLGLLTGAVLSTIFWLGLMVALL